MKTKYLLILIFSLASVLTFSQELGKSNFKIPEDDQNYGSFAFFEGVYHHGRYLKNSDDLADLMANPYNSFEFKVGLQSTGEKLWQQYWGYPSYGIGFYDAFFGSTESVESPLGKPSALYIFYSGPIKRWKKLGFFYEMSVGLSYDFNEYNPITNPINDIIGSNANVYLSGKFFIQYMLSQRIDLIMGLDLTHFSNGNTRTPNMGLNLYGPSVSVKYNFNPIKNYTRKIDKNYKPHLRPEFEKSEWPEKDKSHFIHILVAAGGKTTNSQIYDGPTYFVSTIALDWTKQYSRIARYGAGLDFFYDSAIRDNMHIPNAQFKDLAQIGIHFGNELLISRFDFITQLGFYLYNEAGKGPFWLRFNLRFLVTDNFGIQGGLKTLDGGAADFIEWGLYFRLMKK